MRTVGIITSVSLFALMSTNAYAQAPAPTAPTPVETALVNAFNDNVNTAMTAAINGPDQLKKAQALQAAIVAWKNDEGRKLAEEQNKNKTLTTQISSLNEQVNVLRKELETTRKMSLSSTNVHPPVSPHMMDNNAPPHPMNYAPIPPVHPDEHFPPNSNSTVKH